MAALITMRTPSGAILWTASGKVWRSTQGRPQGVRAAKLVLVASPANYDGQRGGG
jgi:hypothetical protein